MPGPRGTANDGYAVRQQRAGHARPLQANERPARDRSRCIRTRPPRTGGIRTQPRAGRVDAWRWRTGDGRRTCRGRACPARRGPTARRGATMIAPASRKLGKYEIRYKLGRGGMADVYLAYDSELKHDVALKLI